MKRLSTNRIMEGIEEAKRGNTLLGLKLLKDSVNVPEFPEAKAWYGYCLAREMNDYKEALSLCNEARQKNPGCSDIYLALGRIYLLVGNRSSAVRALETGLKLDNNRQISRLLNSIGIRKPPVFRFLDRSSRVNVTSGRLFSKIGIR